MSKVVAIVAGEASGDLIGSRLMRQLRKKYSDIKFVGVGGPLMETAGLQVLFPYQRLALHGFGWDVLKQVPSLIWQRRKLAEQMLALQPDLFIGVDAPDFNLSLEAYLKQHGIPTVHYVSPSIWAWRKGRINKIVRSVSHLLTLFPFEADYYKGRNIKVDYVGHPLADVYSLITHTNQAREILGISAASQVIAVLPGSRMGEVEQLAEIMLQTMCNVAKDCPDALFLVPLVNRETKQLFETKMYQIFDKLQQWPNIRVMFGHAKLAMQASDVVLVASGTATLEAALLKKPMLITYKVSWLSWQILRHLRYLPYVGLPNILLGDFVVPELLQSDAKPDKLAAELIDLLHNKQKRKHISESFSALHKSLRQNTDAKVLAVIEQYLK